MNTPIAKLSLVTGTERAVCVNIEQRQQAGIAKYGVTVADNPLHLREWLQHAYEETLDQAIYLRRAMEELDRMPVLTISAIDSIRYEMVVASDNEPVPSILKPGDKLAVMCHKAGD